MAEKDLFRETTASSTPISIWISPAAAAAAAATKLSLLLLLPLLLSILKDEPLSFVMVVRLDWSSVCRDDNIIVMSGTRTVETATSALACSFSPRAISVSISVFPLNLIDFCITPPVSFSTSASVPASTSTPSSFKPCDEVLVLTSRTADLTIIDPSSSFAKCLKASKVIDVPGSDILL